MLLSMIQRYSVLKRGVGIEDTRKYVHSSIGFDNIYEAWLVGRDFVFCCFLLELFIS